MNDMEYMKKKRRRKDKSSGLIATQTYRSSSHQSPQSIAKVLPLLK
jgi:hypothetical protein